MTAGDPFPSNEEMREATTELVAPVRSRLPMRYYGGERWWSMFIAGALVWMTDTVESLIVLMADDLNIDGRTLLRSLYEQVVTFAWIGIDPDRRQFRWLGPAQWERRRLHNDARNFGESILTDEEVVQVKKALGVGEEEPDECGRTRKRRNRPRAEGRVYIRHPAASPRAAQAAGPSWPSRSITGSYEHGHP